MKTRNATLFDPEAFSPALQERIRAGQLDPTKLSVLLHANAQGRIEIPDRHTVFLHGGGKTVQWMVPSLRELFRGEQVPPANMNQYPPEYVPVFFFFERHVLTACAAEGDRTDKELEEIYSALRRRPDGRSLGPVHDFLWQVAVTVLAMRPLSQAVFEAAVGVLERSCRTWQMGASSRNYVGYLRRTLLRD